MLPVITILSHTLTCHAVEPSSLCAQRSIDNTTYLHRCGLLFRYIVKVLISEYFRVLLARLVWCYDVALVIYILHDWCTCAHIEGYLISSRLLQLREFLYKVISDCDHLDFGMSFDSPLDSAFMGKFVPGLFSRFVECRFLFAVPIVAWQTSTLLYLRGLCSLLRFLRNLSVLVALLSSLRLITHIFAELVEIRKVILC